MFEVEIRLPLCKSVKRRLLAGAHPIGGKRVVDTYYDSGEYALTTEDTWLRKRNGAFELKLPVQKKDANGVGERYYEVTDDRLLRKELGLLPRTELGQAIEQRGYAPFVTIQTQREQYEHGQFRIVVDTTDFGYAVAEVELLVSARREMDAAGEHIAAFLKARELPYQTPVRGKVIEYLRLHRPKHFRALVQAGVVA